MPSLEEIDEQPTGARADEALRAAMAERAQLAAPEAGGAGSP